MSLFIDPPRWPAHGTVFSHLISDHSYAELHQFADSIGLSRRAFDGDHYDVPAKLYENAIRAGATPITGAELVKRLRRSDLRIPARERPGRVISVLRGQWQALEPQRPSLGEELIGRWSEEHRHYHTPVHLLECLTALDTLASTALRRPAPREAILAAWFHDAVYEGRAGDDEEKSAEFAKEALGGYLGQEVARLVLLTREHSVRSANDKAGELLVDADLSILGAPRGRYRRYVDQVREEHRDVTDDEWRCGRLAVLEQFAARVHLYYSSAARQLWQERANLNMGWEMRTLRHS